MKVPLFFSLLILIFQLSAAAQPSNPSAELSLDKRKLSLPCQYPIHAKYRSCPDGMTVAIGTKVTGNFGTSLKYEYAVNEGTIIGDGSNVSWDMSKARPGTYTITVTVVSTTERTQLTASKVITVEECIDCTRECLDCPIMKISSSKASVRRGETVELQFFNSPGSGVLWTVNGGRIIKGQGARDVTVKINKNLRHGVILINATVKEGEFCFDVGGCPKTATLKLPVVQR